MLAVGHGLLMTCKILVNRDLCSYTLLGILARATIIANWTAATLAVASSIGNMQVAFTMKSLTAAQDPFMVIGVGAASLVIHWILSLLIVVFSFWLFNLSVEPEGTYQAMPKDIDLADYGYYIPDA